jgi:cytochrome c oxidase subunit 2
MHKILGLPELASEHGHDVDKLIIYVHVLMLALFVGWMLYYVYVLFRFRSSRNPKAEYIGVRSHANHYIELAVIIAEGALLFGLAIPLWAKAVDKFPSESEAVVIRVAAQQFAWNIRYPGPDGKFAAQDFTLVSAESPMGYKLDDPNGKDDIGLLNEIHVPVNKPVIIHLTSKDVIHSLKIIAMRVTQDAIPGMNIPLWFKPTREGKYQINCAQLCGMGHYTMTQGYVIVESEEKYNQWIAEKAKTAGANSTTYE